MADPKVLERRSNTPGITPGSQDSRAKSDFLKNPQEGKIPTWPGDYELKSLVLTSPNREGTVDLRAAWTDFNIYENIFSSSLTANIDIIDGVGLMESVPIIGEETIHFQAKTKGIVRDRSPKNNFPGPFEGSQNEGRISLSFRVVKINDIVKLNDQMMTYRLSLVSEEAIINIKQKVRKSALDPVDFKPSRISDVVKRLYKQYFKNGTY